MDWAHWFQTGLPYGEYLNTHGTEAHRQRWQAVYDRIQLTDQQRELLAAFTRDMNVVVLSGTWCGDCVNQGPIFRRFEEATDRIRVRFLERDEHPELRDALKINGGNRVPVVVFLSEDFMECARYGERVLAFYRQLAKDQLGPACPAGVVPPGDELLAQATQEWLTEFERIHLMLRLSARLRERHGD